MKQFSWSKLQENCQCRQRKFSQHYKVVRCAHIRKHYLLAIPVTYILHRYVQWEFSYFIFVRL